MNLVPRLWTTSPELTSDPFRAMRREMENTLRAFNQNLSSPDIGVGAPAINVAETKDAFEVTAELPGVDEKDIKVSLDGNRLVISGEKKEETKKEEKDWHVEERSYGSSVRCLCHSSRRTQLSRLISTRVCCISISRSLLRPQRPPSRSISRQALHRARRLNPERSIKERIGAALLAPVPPLTPNGLAVGDLQL